MNKIITTTMIIIILFSNIVIASESMIDQQQTSIDNCAGDIKLGYYWSQSFKPSKKMLDKIEILPFGIYGNGQVILSVKDAQGKIIATNTINIMQTNSGWLTFDFQDVSVMPDNIYYIVVTTNSPTRIIDWACNHYYDAYANGEMHFLEDITSYGGNFDFAFKTYGYDCIPNWSCSDWSSCSNNLQTRSCDNQCGNATTESQSCSILPTALGITPIPIPSFFTDPAGWFSDIFSNLWKAFLGV